jgi:predicted choloylglycine hydrolase
LLTYGSVNDMLTSVTTAMTLFGINEPRPGKRWKALFDAVWPAYRSWYLSEGRDARPRLDTAAYHLNRHMPELVPTWRRMVELTGDDELAATMLTLWDPPKFLPGCSQAALTSPPVLVRNYDYSPDLFEQVVYSSKFGDRRVIGTGDCLWGLLDGMNDAGLAVSLTFGGRPGSAPGFAAPLVLRYLLEVASNTEEARSLLRDLPVSMSYNFTLVDTEGTVVTAYLAPGEPAEFIDSNVATNHRGDTPEFPDHARRFRSVERQRTLRDLVAADPSPQSLGQSFLKPPLFNDDYDHAFGTLYTAVYRPRDGEVDYLWRDDTWTRSFSSPEETKTVRLGAREDGDVGSTRAVSTVIPAHSGDFPAPSQAESWASLTELSMEELATLTQRAVNTLAQRADDRAFFELLRLYEVLGVALGESARTLAERGSWAHVAGVAGVSRQAAWHRWKD